MSDDFPTFERPTMAIWALGESGMATRSTTLMKNSAGIIVGE